MAVVVEASALCWGFFCGIMKPCKIEISRELSFLPLVIYFFSFTLLFLISALTYQEESKELRGYLIALLFAINYDKCYYIRWNTYHRIDGNSRTAPDPLVGFFILQKNLNFFIKSVDII